MNPSSRAATLFALASLIALLSSSPALAQGFLDSTYTGPTGGTWFNAAHWTPSSIPNNGPFVFGVTVDGSTVSQTVRIDSASATIQALNLFNNATVEVQSGNTLSVLGTTLLDASSRVRVDATTADATATLGNMVGLDFDGIDYSDLLLGGLAVSASSGRTATVRFNGADLSTNEGVITLSGTGTTRILDDSDNDALANFDTNLGGFMVSSGKTYTTLNGLFLNAGYLAAAGSGSQLTVTQTALPNGTLLNPGPFLGLVGQGEARWQAIDGGTIKFQGLTGSGLFAISQGVTVGLTGAASSILKADGTDGMTNLAINNGRIEIANGRDLTTTGDLGNFNSAGAVRVQASTASTTFLIQGNLSQISGATSATLTGGTWEIFGTDYAGTVKVAGFTGDITTIGAGASVNLSGVNAQFLNGNDANALANLASVAGEFVVDSRNFSTVGDFSVTGTLTLQSRGAGRTFTINGNLAEIVGGELTAGTLEADSAGGAAVIKITGLGAGNITSIGANGAVTLTGTQSFIRNNSDQDTLTNLSSIAGSLALWNGRSVTTAGNPSITGTVSVFGMTDDDTTFTVSGNLAQLSGTTLTAGYFNAGQFTGTGEAKIIIPNADIRTIASGAGVLVAGVQGSIEDQAAQNAIRNLHTVNGDLVLSDGKDLTLATLTNSGYVAVDGGSTLTVSGNFTQGSTGILDLGGSDDLGGNLVVSGATFSVDGQIIGSGGVEGHLNALGIVSPGNSPGQLDVDGSLTYTGTTTTLIELGGTNQGITYDYINVFGTPGTWLLDGLLNLQFVNSFQNLVTTSDVFTVGTSTGALTGAFDNIASGSRLNTVDGYGSFLVNYGGGFGNLIQLSQYQAVPEPTRLLLLLAGTAALLLRRTRRP